MSNYASMSRGLGALLGNPVTDESQKVAIERIRPFQFQRRRFFNPETLEQLAASIKSVGILEPLIVRPTSTTGIYELVAGEQRLRSATIAGLTEVPVIIRELNDVEAREVSLAENLLRENLNPVDETEGILELLSIKLENTVEEVVSLLYQGKNDSSGRSKNNVVLTLEGQTIEQAFSRLGIQWISFVNHRLSLLNLPEDILVALRSGKLEYTKAKAIAQVKDPLDREGLLSAALEEKLTLTQIKEQLSFLKPDSAAPFTPKQQFKEAFQQVSKSKVWDDPAKEKKLLRIMEQLRSLLED